MRLADGSASSQFISDVFYSLLAELNLEKRVNTGVFVWQKALTLYAGNPAGADKRSREPDKGFQSTRKHLTTETSSNARRNVEVAAGHLGELRYGSCFYSIQAVIPAPLSVAYGRRLLYTECTLARQAEVCPNVSPLPECNY